LMIGMNVLVLKCLSSLFYIQEVIIE